MDLTEVKVCLRAVLSANPMSYHVNTLLRDFKSTTGFSLPLFGHLNPVEFLKSINDTVQLKGDPWNPEVALVESEKSAHIISLVNRQRVNERVTLKNHSNVNPQRRHVIPVKRTLNSNKSDGNTRYEQHYNKADIKPLFLMSERNFYDCGTITANKSQSVDSNTESAVLTEMSAEPEKEDNESWKKASDKSVDRKNADDCYFESASDDESCQSTENSRGDSCPEPSGSSEFVNSGIKSKLQKLIKSYPEGLWCCELPSSFYKKFNFVLDYREYGYTSLIQMLSELPDVFRCVRPGDEDWILFDASAPPSEREKRIVNFHLKGDLLCGVKANVQKLLSESFEGVELDKISELYQKTFGTALECSSLGFKDVKSLLEMWEGSVLNLVNVCGKVFCCPAGTVHSPVRWEEALPPITAENDIFAEIFPKEVAGPEEDFPQLDLKRHIAVGHVVEVSVAEVWSPSKFFLQLNKYKSQLNQFMDALQGFYNVHLNKYKMPESTLRPNQICVGLYNADPENPDEWHRAQIIKVINEKTVLINFVDYGTVTRVKKTYLRFLHRRFRSFPVQAIQAQLSGVAPPNDEAMWPMTTSKKFLGLLRVSYLNAQVVAVDFKVPMLTVILHDPAQKLSINRKLIRDKLARAEESVYFEEEVSESDSKTGGLKTVSLPKKKEVLKNNETSQISYEFEEIPELKETANNTKPEMPAAKTNPQDKPPQPVPETLADTPRLPPGLEHVNPLPFLLHPQDLRKKINVLAMELLTQNESIKQVGVNDPGLALRIATEMAEAYLSPEIALGLPLRYRVYPVLGQGAVGDVGEKAVEGECKGIISPDDSAPPASNSKRTAESRKYVEEAQIGGKTLRLVKVDGQAFFPAEELVRLFTSFSSREIADRLLHTKKVKADYRVISKKSDEKVLQALKSSGDLLGVKRKSKQLKVYLLPVGNVTAFLRALGCRTESFESELEELVKRWEEKKGQKTEVSC